MYRLEFQEAPGKPPFELRIKAVACTEYLPTALKYFRMLKCWHESLKSLSTLNFLYAWSTSCLPRRVGTHAPGQTGYFHLSSTYLDIE